MQGKFIVLEGTDGSGKTTQQKLLIKRAKDELGLKVYQADFPQYEKSFFGAMAGRFLSGEFGGIKDVDPHLASMIFALDRWEASKGIKKALKQGKLVISNRYTMSNMAHQTAKVEENKKKEFIKFLEKMEYEVLELPKEDLNIFLYIRPEIGQMLVDKKTKRSYLRKGKRDIQEADGDHLKDSSVMYKAISSIYPERVKMIDCSARSNGGIKRISEIHDMIWDLFIKELEGLEKTKLSAINT